MNNTEILFQILQSVIDPDTGVDVFSMGVADIEEYEEAAGSIVIRFTPTNPMCPMAFYMADEIRRKLKESGIVQKVSFNVSNYFRAKELKELVSDDTRVETPPDEHAF